MKDYLSVIEHRGKKILYANHQNCTPDEITQQIKQSEEVILKMNNPDLLLMVDVRNCEVSEETVEQFKETGKKIKNFRSRTAVLGITGVRKLILISVNKLAGLEAKAFENENEAKDWLIS